MAKQLLVCTNFARSVWKIVVIADISVCRALVRLKYTLQVVAMQGVQKLIGIGGKHPCNAISLRHAQHGIYGVLVVPFFRI